MTTTHEREAAFSAWRERNPLRAWRLAHDVTLMRLAGEAQVSISTLQLWENGARTPRPAQFETLARITGESHLAGAWRRWIHDRPNQAPRKRTR
ncbi:MAG: hypothetical protein CUN53_00070 [Phototrophicales bacterium]|nr:MAG: hypothetical protein CUN53_00070 [Phototrophicales bacterium]